LESGQLSGYYGLRARPGDERPVAIDPSRTFGSTRLEAEFANSPGYWSTESQRVFAHF